MDKLINSKLLNFERYIKQTNNHTKIYGLLKKTNINPEHLNVWDKNISQLINNQYNNNKKK